MKAAWATLLILTPIAANAADDKAPDFNRDVRPILSNNCFHCHGPDKEARQAELRLDNAKDAARVLGKTGDLLKRITSKDADTQMPPPASKLSLSKSEIETLKSWVNSGAKYDRHWAFLPVKRPKPPVVKNAKRVANDIDRFILTRLEQHKLTLSPRASRETLIRRVTFDLTGLPPTLEEIDAFVNDKSPKAYEKLVDRLLKSSAYGERMAAVWLDVARYSDTYGYQVDRDRFVWPWRDWVVKAFNRNMPYDQFVTWQLAGDLLNENPKFQIPNSNDAFTREDRVLATTFNRLHPQKVEGGSVPEEFRVEYVADRTHTFATAFLGLTMECCRCHDHKFDPISQKEYYSLYAFFNNIDEAGLYSYFTPSIPTPTLWLTDDATKKRITAARRKIDDEVRTLRSIPKSRTTQFEAWLNQKRRASRRKPDDSSRKRGALPPPIAHLDFQSTNIGGNKRVPGKVGQAVQLTGDDAVGLRVGNFTRYQPFSVSLWMKTPKKFKRAVVFHRSRAWTDAGSRGYELLIEEGKLSFALIHFYPGNAIRIRTKKAIPLNEWQHVTVTYDGSSQAGGQRIWLNGKPAEVDIVKDKLRKNITGGGGNNIAIGARFRDQGFTNGVVDEFKVFNRELTPLEAAQMYDGHSLVDALRESPKRLSKKKRAALYLFYLSNFDEQYGKQLATVRAARQQLSKLTDGLKEIMVMREMRKRRPTYLLKRGEYNKPADRVTPTTPAAFPAMRDGLPKNRLGLARWLTDPNNPLTARVAVNRFWQMLFGQGLVRTPEDFGSQGHPPTHPKLLDWLASEFTTKTPPLAKGGPRGVAWDVKRLLKLIVMSETYRQASANKARRSHPAGSARAQPGGFEDGENKLLSRFPRQRLSAEMLRDNALAVSGLLVRKIGGPPVRPYEVEASFKPVKRNRGEGLYRRSLYTYWKRTAPAPVMMVLDASKRDVCRVKREQTSSPLQPLVMLNGPQFAEASRVTAQRLIQKHGDKTEAILVDLFRLLTSRRPSKRELSIVRNLYESQLTAFQKSPAKATAYLTTGDAKRDPKIPATRLAALAVVANTLLNYDGCVMKR